MKNKILIAAAAGGVSRIRAGEHAMGAGTVHTELPGDASVAPRGGVSHAAKGKGVCTAGECNFLIAAPVKSFDSGDSNRDLHMLEVTRGAQFPMVIVRTQFPEAGDQISYHLRRSGDSVRWPDCSLSTRSIRAGGAGERSADNGNDSGDSFRLQDTAAVFSDRTDPE